MEKQLEIQKQESQNATNKTIIFLNPLASNSNVWKNYKSYYSSEFKIITINYPGFGGSEYSYVSSIEDLSNQIIKDISEYIVGEVYIVGYSLGSWIAQNVASYYSNIQGLVLIGTSHHVLVHGKLIAEHWINLIEENGIDRFLESLSLWSFSSETYEEIERVGLYLQNSALQSFNDSKAISDQVNMIKKYTIGANVEDFKFPVLIIRGEEDLLYPEFSSTDLRKMIPNCSIYRIPKSGHSVILENPKRVIKGIDSFFERIKGDAGY